MATLGKQDINGEIGESRTKSILLKNFWVLKRTPDIDGADFLVQIPKSTLNESRSSDSQIEPMGIVQSKFFQGSNEVKIQVDYVLDNGVARPDFFCILHTDDEKGENVYYFFKSDDIIKEFKIRDDFYVFSLSRDRQYSEYKNVSKEKINDLIIAGVSSAKVNIYKDIIAKLYCNFKIPTQHHDKDPQISYHLKIIDGVKCVICKDNKKSHKYLLEMRRDIYNTLGEYNWGSDSVGCQFLSVSILAHHLNGETPSSNDVEKFLYNIIAVKNSDQQHIITSNEITDSLNLNFSDIDFLRKKSESLQLSDNCGVFLLLNVSGKNLELLYNGGGKYLLQCNNSNLLDRIKICQKLVNANKGALVKKVLLMLYCDYDENGNILKIHDRGIASADI